MIYRNETFGLVYLEAMARGCITIASRNEGFDGVIEHGVNGFLCKAGDSKELASIINQIRTMPSAELQRISHKAMQTAASLTDKKAAERYLEAVKNIVKKQ
jgi:glycosyltransferase involved in cell wall biosynthesis